jgi:hypothetical protein
MSTDFEISVVTKTRVFNVVTVTAKLSIDQLDTKDKVDFEYFKLVNEARTYLDERGFVVDGPITRRVEPDFISFGQIISVSITGWKDE